MYPRLDLVKLRNSDFPDPTKLSILGAVLEDEKHDRQPFTVVRDDLVPDEDQRDLIVEQLGYVPRRSGVRRRTWQEKCAELTGMNLDELRLPIPGMERDRKRAEAERKRRARSMEREDKVRNDMDRLLEDELRVREENEAYAREREELLQENEQELGPEEKERKSRSKSPRRSRSKSPYQRRRRSRTPEVEFGDFVEPYSPPPSPPSGPPSPPPSPPPLHLPPPLAPGPLIVPGPVGPRRSTRIRTQTRPEHRYVPGRVSRGRGKVRVGRGWQPYRRKRKRGGQPVDAVPLPVPPPALVPDAAPESNWSDYLEPAFYATALGAYGYAALSPYFENEEPALMAIQPQPVQFGDNVIQTPKEPSTRQPSLSSRLYDAVSSGDYAVPISAALSSGIAAYATSKSVPLAALSGIATGFAATKGQTPAQIAREEKKAALQLAADIRKEDKAEAKEIRDQNLAQRKMEHELDLEEKRAARTVAERHQTELRQLEREKLQAYSMHRGAYGAVGARSLLRSPFHPSQGYFGIRNTRNLRRYPSHASYYGNPGMPESYYEAPAMQHPSQKKTKSKKSSKKRSKKGKRKRDEDDEYSMRGIAKRYYAERPKKKKKRKHNFSEGPRVVGPYEPWD